LGTFTSGATTAQRNPLPDIQIGAVIRTNPLRRSGDFRYSRFPPWDQEA
jgi:hypothetical protein